MPYNAKTNWQYDDIVTESDLNRIEQGIKDAHDQLDPAAPIPITLAPGQQIITVPKTAPYNVLNITGRTLVNLLGRDGNCEDTVGWNTFSGTLYTDSSNAKYKSYAHKLVITGTNGNTYRDYLNKLVSGKYYLLVADIKNGNANYTRLIIQLIGGAGTKFSSNVTNTSSFEVAYITLSPTDFSTASAANIGFQVVGSSGQYGYADGFRLYEIAAEEKAYIEGLSVLEAQRYIAAKYPYVDDMKSIVNPYMIKYGENLLPPFSEWEVGMQTGDTYSINAPYDVTINATTSGNSFLRYFAPVVSGQVYSLGVTGSGDNAVMYAYWSDANKVRLTGTRLQGENLTAPTGAVYMEVLVNTLSASFTALTGVANFKNPMLNIGNTAKPFKPRNDQMLVYPVQLASSEDGSVYDTLYSVGKKTYKLNRFKTMDLDGSLNWSFISGAAGYKTVGLSGFSNAVKSSSRTVKYDGKILQDLAWGTPGTSGDQVFMGGVGDSANGYRLVININNTDSGWGDNYTPTPQEIQAFFRGWRMYTTGMAPYNGSGPKAWVEWGGTDDVNFQTSSSVPTTESRVFADKKYTRYKLQYQLATPYAEQIQPEGSITLHESANQIEVGNGMIVREKANIYIGASSVLINGSLSYPLSKRTSVIKKVYKGDKEDPSWAIKSYGTTNATLGNSYAELPLSNYDPTAAYEVTYLALDQHTITCNLTQITGEYDPNMKTIVDRLALNQADIETRLSVVENTKARKVQGQWITPTLLNGHTVETTVGYMKDENGFVHLKGRVTGGSDNTDIFLLPPGYRPNQYIITPTIVFDGTNYYIARVTIYPTGWVRLIGVKTTWNSLDGISFLAEQ